MECYGMQRNLVATGYEGFFAPVPLTDCLLGTITRSAAIASYSAAALKNLQLQGNFGNCTNASPDISK